MDLVTQNKTQKELATSETALNRTNTHFQNSKPESNHILISEIGTKIGPQSHFRSWHIDKIKNQEVNISTTNLQFMKRGRKKIKDIPDEEKRKYWSE